MEEVIVIAICIAINALLAAVEMAFVFVGKPRLRELARSGNNEAKKILALRDNPERTLSVIQIGITLVGALAAAVGGASAEEWISPIFQTKLGVSENVAETIAIMVIVLPITYLSVVIGELVPKTLALRNPLAIVLRSARWLVLFDRILSPAVYALEWSTKNFLNIFFRRSKLASTAPPTPATDVAEQLEELSQQHKQYVFNLVNIEKKKIKDAMLLWDRVNRIDFSQSATEVESMVLASGHTRLPIVKEGAVVGLLHTKEFISFRKSGKNNWDSIIRPVLQIQENYSILKALRAMQERRSHLAVVYAGNRLAGIVTLEDLIEEIVGDIYDEDDDGALRKVLSTGVSFRSLGVGQKNWDLKTKRTTLEDPEFL